MMAASYFFTLANIPAAEEELFFRKLRCSNGTFKTTERKRLDTVNATLFEVMARRGLVPRTVMDVGVSSGITTLEWLRAFSERGTTVAMIATDFTMSVYRATLNRWLGALLERNGHLLQLEILGFGIRAWTKPRDYLTGSILWRRPLLGYARRRIAPLDLASPLGALHEGRLYGPFRLVAPELRHYHDIRLIDDDVLAPNPPDLTAVADVVRAANLLQPSSFSAEQIVAAARHLRERCRGAGSLVVVCDYDDEECDGSIFRVAENGAFALEARVGVGAIVEELILSA